MTIFSDVPNIEFDHSVVETSSSTVSSSCIVMPTAGCPEWCSTAGAAWWQIYTFYWYELHGITLNVSTELSQQDKVTVHLSKTGSEWSTHLNQVSSYFCSISVITDMITIGIYKTRNSDFYCDVISSKPVTNAIVWRPKFQSVLNMFNFFFQI